MRGHRSRRTPRRRYADQRRVAPLVAVSLLSAAVAIAVHATAALNTLELDAVDARFAVRGSEVPRSDVAVVSVAAGQPLAHVIDRLRAAHPKLIVLDRAAGAAGASSSFPVDGDGTVRRMYYTVGGAVSPPVAVAARLRALPVPRDGLRGDGTAWIDFPGSAGTVQTLRLSAPKRLLAGKVLVVGAMGARVTTPTSGLAHPELEADAIATALRGFPLRSTPPWLALVLISALAAVPAILSFRMRPLTAYATSLLTALLFALAAQLLFAAGAILPVVTPLLALVLASGGALAVSYRAEAIGRRATRLTFARFVPPPVVEEVLAQPARAVHPGGVRRDATVLFSDLREFTRFAEEREPEQVIEILNRYLSEMSHTVRAHGGTVVSYMGDGMMAVFGAPVQLTDHADRALAAVREMLARFREFNEWLTATHGAAAMRIGIGVNSGPVISGNVGSDERLEYAAIGDTTNTAARLEGMTKGTPHQVFISESTRLALSGETNGLVYVDELAVRGRTASVRIWTMAGDK